MARKNRIWYPGAIYHVMSRGNRKTSIFSDISDYLNFLEYILLIREKHPFTLHALCLMTNHFHMILETEDTELWRIMQKILSCYAEEYNYRHKTCGHLFGGRYTSCIIDSHRYLLEASRYIHLNPVKANIVTDPIDYEFSSYRAYVGNNNGGSRHDRIGSELISDLVDTSLVLGCFDNSCEEYRKFVEERVSHAEQEMIIQKDIHEDEFWLPVGV